MLAAVKGIVRGNTVVIDNDDLQNYDGEEVVMTFLNYTDRKPKQKPAIDWENFRMPSERGSQVEKYMKEMRENDRL